MALAHDLVIIDENFDNAKKRSDFLGKNTAEKVSLQRCLRKVEYIYNDKNFQESLTTKYGTIKKTDKLYLDNL